MVGIVDVYLTDEFVKFSDSIKEIHQAKKTKQEELKQLFDKAKAEIKELDDHAVDLKSQWELFVANNGKK